MKSQRGEAVVCNLTLSIVKSLFLAYRISNYREVNSIINHAVFNQLIINIVFREPSSGNLEALIIASAFSHAF